MATARPKPKSATEVLTEKYTALIEDAAKRMTPEEFRQAQVNAESIMAEVRARASRERKRGKR